MPVLFAPELKRLDLLQLPKNEKAKKIRIAIFRNHSFEMVAAVLNKFLNYSDFEAEFVYSDYDDSLNFQNTEGDLNIIWVDTDRYKTNKLEDFLKERAATLRAQTTAPLLILHIGRPLPALNNSTTDCFSFHLNDPLLDLGDAGYDLAKEPFSGTRLSNKACLVLARLIGLKYIPAVMKPALKAIVTDLDETLYRGILGEEGIEGVELTPEHKRLQEQLKELKKEGFFLCLSSKNEEKDVRALFKKRTDFILSWDDFTATEINWAPKPENILKLSKVLNIGTDSILFIDDNPAEIQNVETSGLGIKTIQAQNPEQVLQMLKFYPGLTKLRMTDEDRFRSEDIKANQERAQLAQTLSPREYFKKLGIRLTYAVDVEEQVPRISELLRKTNQFILTYARFPETDVKQLMQSENDCVITIQMSDNLSDSGIIAILAAHKNKNEELVLKEMVVSCRALGRNLENIMLPYLFLLAREKLKTSDTLRIHYQKGERNTPAIDWLKRLTSDPIDLEKGFLIYNIPASVDLSGLEIEVE